ncbi:glycerophosphodiester phosphodiesterase [Haloarcula regularis]|uniref:glycerophosphodiester phosphodiesterase n=1 Tax=Haloarcula regularis TaxID=3033392 RepID=UPI0023E8659A|nr:glycerophosphodiester phosphodiesterase [Halomicroarcula sp. SYNS111]
MADPPTTIAHRGFAGHFPENTVAAVRGAADCGADVVEVDVMPTGDGDVVVFHDNHLGDTDESRGVTDCEGLVWDRPTDVVTGRVSSEPTSESPRSPTSWRHALQTSA